MTPSITPSVTPSVARLLPCALAASVLLLAPSRAHAFDEGDNCEVTGCGGNTPVLFGSPIIGLSLASAANSRGVVLDPELERVAPPAVAFGACPTGATLDVQSGELIGRWAAGTCSRQGLIGMAFTLWVPTAPCGEVPADRNLVHCGRKARVRVRFGAVSSVPTWAMSSPEQLITYQLVWHEFPDGEPLGEGLVVGESICPLREAWMEDWQNGTPTGGAPTGFERWKEETDQLLIVHGETYHADGRVDMSRRGAQWLNLGCVGSALAKARLLDNDPMAAPWQWQLRQATLKMLAARYQGQRSYTRPGVPLYYQRWDGKAFHGLPTSGVSGAVEAAWDEHGAMCLSHRRTWHATALDGEAPLIALSHWLAAARPEGPPPGGPVLIPANPDVFALYEVAEEDSLAPLRSGGLPTCGNAPPTGYLWQTMPVHHVPH